MEVHMMLRAIVNAAFIPLIEAYEGFELDQKEMQKDLPIGFLKHNVIEKCYNSIVGFFSFHDWFIHDVGFSYISQNDNLTEEQKLTLMGFKPSKEPNQKPKYENIMESSRKITHIISQYEINDDKVRDELSKDFCSKKNNLKPFQALRNKLVHGSAFEVGDDYIVDGDVDIKAYYKNLASKFGFSYNEIKSGPFDMEFLSINVNQTLEIAYELSKQILLTLKCFWKACYGGKEYKHLEGLDYVSLISFCDVEIPTILKERLVTDFPEKFKPSSPPSSSQ